MGESFRLSAERAQGVNLGCGTLILIAIIVMIFSQGGTSKIENEINGLRNEVSDLKISVQAQTEEIRQLRAKLSPSEKF